MTLPPLYGVGHSNRSIGQFIEVLGSAGIECLVDIRAFSRSRTNPQFNGDVLPASLDRAGIGYEHLPGLGGRRRKSRDVDPAVNGHWRVAGFHNYADYALSPAFRESFEALLRISVGRRAAMMCSEMLWWRCHRRIVADYALAAGRAVHHIFDVGHVESAGFNDGAVVHDDGSVTYPAQG
ncbi:Protein of unknown function, DUF488 [Luteibacter sp. UNCMF331Sha3.1]|uniref:DUF488 domain-containing protein n=1 Tax=Luteibacter sp. UNCMF331Sha3.1 TaxID=1502760 RepID=UPI0008C579C1|nr:DUF488 domain-containing protein [Luteibacter sp. UNCMF331Sha3.1]SEN17475.1 Protein of unknown function, DUF488 [Luteibacter sp. UNCMF331Sha3.1]